MRIGLMLRHYDQHRGGVRVYTHQIIKSLLALNSGHEFFFFYRDPALVGTYKQHAEVHEIALPNESMLWWDQVLMPRAVASYGIDVLFNPKYSLPLRTQCPSAWVCHGLDWYVMPWASPMKDRLSHGLLVPHYARKASAIFAVSEVTREHVMEYLKVPEDRVHTVYSGVDPTYLERCSPEKLESVRTRYRLPSRFVLYSGAIYPPKNFTRLIQAYARVGPSLGIPLVIAGGENRFLSEHEVRLPDKLGLQAWVLRPGWIDLQSLPAVYQLADALLLPSLFESFGLPIIEAMASECPVVTSNCYGTKEIAQDAAVLVEPQDVDSIAAGIVQILSDGELRKILIERGKVRARQFDWHRCARQTLSVLEQLGAMQRSQTVFA
jgi:glycosyltransferase involved in cell wall biosynthesis